MRKRRLKAAPVCITGCVVFEFFHNDDEDFKIRELIRLAKILRKELNVSALPYETNIIENPERGAIAFSLVATSLELGRNTQNKVLEFLDKHAPARILSEEIETVELSG